MMAYIRQHDRRQRTRAATPSVRRGLLVLAGLAAVLASTVAVEAQIKARVRRVGLFEGTVPMVRSGCTSFVEVEFANEGSQVFDGEARINQQDRDGDVVTSVQEVDLTPDGVWHPRQIYFYPTNVGSYGSLRIRLYDNDGNLVKMESDTGEVVNELVAPEFTDQPSPDEFLIVDLTTPKKLAHALCLDTAAQGEQLYGRRVRPMTPTELPQEWQGLEAVDAIVWDDADGAISEKQANALIEWVKNGGRLLISGGRANWQALANSTLAAHLPVRITGIRDAREAPEFSRDIIKNISMADRLERAYAKSGISRCDVIKLPEAIAIPSNSKGSSQIAFRLLLGRGSLTFVAASIRELLPPPPRALKVLSDTPDVDDKDQSAYAEFRDWCDRIVAVNFLALPRSRENESGLITVKANLFDVVASTIGYKGLGFAFMMFALLFAVAYLATAGGSYFYLKRRDWQAYSWTAFALVSLAATVVGVIMVWSLRGVTTKVRQTMVVDARAGDDYGRGACFFGVKTPDHTRLNLRLPSGHQDEASLQNGIVRTLPRSVGGDIGSVFVASDTYIARRNCEELADVPIRATLKEFYGRWHGPLGGTLDARLVLDDSQERTRFGGRSYIHNNTGVRLENCYLLEGPQEIAGEGGNVLTRCLFVGTLEKEGDRSKLEGETLTQQLYFQKPDPTRPADPPKPIPGDQLFLRAAIKDWRNRMGGVLPTFSEMGASASQSVSLSSEQEYFSLLLLSVFNLIEKESGSRYELSRSHGRILDCSHAITRETALLIGYSSDPPPARLEIDGMPRRPEKSITMYRFVIPVERPRPRAADASSPPTSPAEEAEKP